MRRGVVVAGVIAVAGLVWLVAAWATEDRDYAASTAQPPPLFTLPLIALKPGQEACSREVTVESHSEQARFQAGTRGKEGPPLRVTLRWAGSVLRQTVPGGYADNAILGFAVAPPPGPRLATICFENRGRVPVDLFGSDGARTPGREVFGGDKSRSTTTVDGRRIAANPVLSLYESKPRSILERLPASASRISTFRPGGSWWVWLLGALFVFGVPVGLAWALLRAAAETEAET